jgi:hypothetical protein
MHRKKARERRALTSWKVRREEQVRTAKESEQGVLTPCRTKRKGQVRTVNKSERARGTHFLEGAE